MKTKHYFLIAAVGMFTLAAGSAMAFHGGGVAHCDGCHSMHNSPENPVSGTPNGSLLKGSDASSTCLNCHDGAARYHINSADGSNTTEGGDFYWVANPYTVIVRGNPYTFGGENAGHNIVASDFGLVADATNTQAPGGTYAASKLGCTSCHDAHGQVLDGTAGGSAPISVSGSYGDVAPTGTIAGNFRILGDSLYEAGDHGSDGFAFTYDAPVAQSNSYTGASTRYGSGMSEWCGNCHGQYLFGNGKHPVAASLDNGLPYQGNYNSYVKTGDFTGTQGTSYDDLVPFETGSTDRLSLTPFSTEGPVAGSQVMCLSCHRAHASPHNNAGRWDFEVEFIAESHALESADVPATAAVYYKDGATIDVVTEYGAYQRSLCNKCHVQD